MLATTSSVILPSARSSAKISCSQSLRKGYGEPSVPAQLVSERGRGFAPHVARVVDAGEEQQTGLGPGVRRGRRIRRYDSPAQPRRAQGAQGGDPQEAAPRNDGVQAPTHGGGGLRSAAAAACPATAGRRRVRPRGRA